MFNIKTNRTIEKESKNKISEEDAKKLLQGYQVFYKWDEIPVGTHIRYYKKDGTFVRGGFVQNHWISKDGEHVIYLANSLYRNSNYKNWPVKHSNVKTIYIKKKEDDLYKEQAGERINELQTAIKRIVSYVKKLNEEITVLKKNQAQLQEIVQRR